MYYAFFQFLAKIWLLRAAFNLPNNFCTCCDDPNAGADAKAIVDSKFDPKTIEKILPYRTQAQCAAINQAIAPLNGGKPLVDPKYVPLQNTKPYDDLLFALVSDSLTVFSMYLGYYLDGKDETFIIMIFIQIDDRMKFKEVYKSQHAHSFDDARKKQRHPFQNALRVWAEENRLPEKAFSQNDACWYGKGLENEHASWNKQSRNLLESILMKVGYNYGRTAIDCYQTDNNYRGGRDLADDVRSYIDNRDLQDLYASLVRYVLNADLYLAELLHDYCDGRDNWAMWIIILTTRRGDGVEKIDEASRHYHNVTLKDYISKCNVQDPQLKDMLTVLSDPSSVPQK